MSNSKELLWEPRSWACQGVDPLQQVSIDVVEGLSGTRYAVRKAGLCMGKAALQFDYEPLPSSRDDEWLDDHRMATLEEAKELFSKWVSSLDGKGLKSHLFRAPPFMGGR